MKELLSALQAVAGSSLREWADGFGHDDAPEEPHNIYKRLEEATILERISLNARPQDLTKLEKRFAKLDIDEIVSYLYFWIYTEYMRSGRFGEIVRDLEQSYQSDMASVMPALSMALNVMHTTGKLATDYAGLSPSELDKLSNLDEEDVATFAKKIHVPFKTAAGLVCYFKSMRDELLEVLADYGVQVQDGRVRKKDLEIITAEIDSAEKMVEALKLLITGHFPDFMKRVNFSASLSPSISLHFADITEKEHKDSNVAFYNAPHGITVVIHGFGKDGSIPNGKLEFAPQMAPREPKLIKKTGTPEQVLKYFGGWLKKLQDKLAKKSV